MAKLRNGTPYLGCVFVVKIPRINVADDGAANDLKNHKKSEN